MAHGGHSGGSHTHYHYHNYSRSRSYDETSLSFGIIAVGIVVILLMLFIAFSNNSISGKQPLEGEYDFYPSYLIDTEEYLSDTDYIVEGLTYLYEQTNVQMVVMTSSDSWTDSKAVDKYYELFSDEGHVLMIVPTSLLSNTVYYAIGDDANAVIDDTAMNYLIDQLNSTKSGEKWKERLISFTDKLLEEK